MQGHTLRGARPPGEVSHPMGEHRQDGPYTDAIVRMIIADRGAADAAAPAGAEETAALEIAAGLVSRAFASARVEGIANPPPAFLLGAVGRDLIVRGEALLVDYGGGLVRANTWEVYGTNPDRDAWRYVTEVPSPEGQRRVSRGGDRVAHPRYSADAARPWQGIGPMQRARTGGALAGALESRMSQEAGGSTGYLLPIPTDAGDDTVSALKADIGKLAGKTALVETTAAGWGEGRTAAPRQDWKPQRLGADWPASTPLVYSAAQLSVLAACGVPVELVQAADGTGQREAWRRCLHGTIQPLGRIVAEELSRVYRRPVTLDFEALAASDIAGRARAFQSMVAAGMEAGAAAAAAGLMEGE